MQATKLASLTSLRFVLPKNLQITQNRWKHRKDHWSVLLKKQYAVDKALAHYDDFYKEVYGNKWPSIRLALLSPHKYCAVINNFGDPENVVPALKNIGALDMGTLFELEKKYIKKRKGESISYVQPSNIYSPEEKKNNKEFSNATADVAKAGNKEDDMFDAKASLQSLHSSLSKAVIDQQRVIDPADGVSAALLYEYIPATKLKGMEDWVHESEHYKYYDSDANYPVYVEVEEDCSFPENLQVLTFERGNISSFPSPKRMLTGVLDYYLMDGASLLPVFALGLKSGDRVLDMCAAPGGKTLAMLQTLCTEQLVCNDVTESRTKRIHSVLKQYLHNLDHWRHNVTVTVKDGRAIQDEDMFNKILVDVPCTTDRHSLHENENNIFKPGRIKERLKIPELQAQLLSQALRIVSKGGTVVYSTCSLSPIQNDGVVHMALRKVWEEYKIEVVVKNMAPALQPMECLFKFEDVQQTRYGHLVVPYIPCNFGPMYFCKIVKI